MGIPMCIPWQVFLWVFLCLVFQVRQVDGDAHVPKARGGKVKPIVDQLLMHTLALDAVCLR